MIIIAGLFSLTGIIAMIGCYWMSIIFSKGKNDFTPFAKKLKYVSIITFVLCELISLLILFGLPNYLVWQQNKEGEAELARAEQNRQIAIHEAKAKEESAKSLANSDIIRAEGVAKANKIIGDSLSNNEAYIHYLWIEALKESNNEVIYIPTEAGIPITESQRFNKKTGN